MKEVILKKSTNPQKNYDAFINNKKRCLSAVPLMKVIQSKRMIKDVTHTSNGTVPHNRGPI